MKKTSKEKPKITLLMAMTVDGIVAKDHEDRLGWTGTTDRKYFVKATKKAGAIIMGHTTYTLVGKPLKDRFNVVMTQDEKQVQQSIPEELLFTKMPPETIIKILHEKGYEHIYLIGGPTINTVFARNNLIDDIQVVMIPKLFGSGLSLFSEPMNLNLEFKESSNLNDDVVVFTYRVIK